MRLLHTALVFLILTPAIAQDPASAQQKAARETRERMQLISTRAFGNFRAAESVEYRLQQEGMTLHPQLIALRARVESALDDARAARCIAGTAAFAPRGGLAQRSPGRSGATARRHQGSGHRKAALGAARGFNGDALLRSGRLRSKP